MRYYSTINPDGKVQLVATQGEVKKLKQKLQPLDVPTDKDGLLEYLNKLFLLADPLEDKADIVESSPPSYVAQSVALDEQWEKLPLARKLHFAALAMEEAREKL